MNQTAKPASPFRFKVLEVSLQAIDELRPILARIREHDADLARQIRRAASSVALNLSEGQRRRGKDRIHHFRVAAGSADEVRVALRVAMAWQIIGVTECEAAMQLLDRVLAMTWRLTERQ